MARNSVDYDRCAADYERRYSARPYAGIHTALSNLVRQPGIARLLEAGCGTGHWLRVLRSSAVAVVGVDPSLGMLQQARLRDPGAAVVCARAEQLPFSARIFDVVFCVNAFHHFKQPRSFVTEAMRVLRRAGGRLAIIGLDPHVPGTEWYLYEYFAGTRQRDLDRYMPHREIAAMLDQAGFREVSAREVEHLSHTFAGADVLRDPFLEKGSTSQLALLSASDYAAGLDRIRTAIQQAEARGQRATFNVQLTLFMVSGTTPVQMR